MSERWPAVLLLVTVVVAAWAGMSWGWRRRAARQSDVPLPDLPPVTPGAPTAVIEGLYVGSVTAGEWLDRVVPHGLGARANAEVAVYRSGVLLERDGSESVWIARDDLAGARRDTGLAGKVTETGGLVVWTWHLGPLVLESGLRPRYADDSGPLLRALTSLTEEAT